MCTDQKKVLILRPTWHLINFDWVGVWGHLRLLMTGISPMEKINPKNTLMCAGQIKASLTQSLWNKSPSCQFGNTSVAIRHGAFSHIVMVGGWKSDKLIIGDSWIDDSEWSVNRVENVRNMSSDETRKSSLRAKGGGKSPFPSAAPLLTSVLSSVAMR